MRLQDEKQREYLAPSTCLKLESIAVDCLLKGLELCTGLESYAAEHIYEINLQVT